MSDQNTQDQVQTTDATPVKVYATRAECESNKPQDAPKGLRPFEVSKGSTVQGFIWARGYDHGLSLMAKRDGYSLSTGKTKEVSKEVVTAKVMEMSDDEFKALVAARKAAVKTK